MFGNKTYKAVRLFQSKNGLKVDGIVGKNTWRALGYYFNTGVKSTSRANVNRGDLWLLSRVVMGEAADEPFTGKVAVAAVILNRVDSPKFPNTLAGVIYQPLAFESVSNGQYTRPVSDEAIRAAQAAMNGWDPTGGALYFWNPYKRVSKWIWTRTIITQIGNHVFAKSI
ncbi:spore cortex-lytic enzyme [Peptococcaceae bacterium]|nr:spore cortex-lytic enzyme [Peptococcaceae bacterium]MCL0107933.1 spore cortex-lytic enzyme [Peptococcaceae bacterium]